MPTHVAGVSLQSNKAWLDSHEQAVREAIAGSQFTLERRNDALVLIAPADHSFTPKRRGMLLPVTLPPLGKIAKRMQADPNSGILILGHTDNVGSKNINDQVSMERAQAVAAIFRLSGMKGDRLLMRGVGPNMPRADNGQEQGRALNRRVEVIMTQQSSLTALAQNY